MKKRLLRTLAIGLLASSIFVGCSNTNTASTPDSQVAKEEGSEENSETQSEAIEASTSMDETNVDYTGKTTLTYIGHASVKIVSKDGTVLYIDPQYNDGNYDDEADYILVTHGHDDHQPNDKVTLKDGGKLITYVETHHDDVYESYDFGSIQVETVAAGGNPNHNIKNCVGYIVTVDGIKVYHAGDTSMIDQMKDLTAKEIDYAMYPIDGQYNMDAVEATQVANLVAAKHNIPIHELDTPGALKSDNFTPEGRMILEYGETIVIGE